MANARFPGKRRGFGAAAVAVGLLALGAGGGHLGCSRTPDRPNVILISIDTLRPDHLHCYGYSRPTSPNIDAYAAAGARFSYVHSSTTWTLPAHISLLSGLPDELHRVVWDQEKLDPRRIMLAQCFKEQGYTTGGFYSGPYLHEIFGFDRGFDIYANCADPTFYDEVREGADPAQREALGFLKERQSHRTRTAGSVQAHVARFLERNADEPFFLFIHHWDVHYDFNAPKEFVDLFAPNYRGDLSMVDFYFNDAINAGMNSLDKEWLLANYDAEIRWVDFHIGKLHQQLEDLGIAEDTYVVITADHGEEFFEHQNKGHRLNLHEETLAIPLIISGPGIRPGVRIDSSARIFDIMPTILDLAGLPPVPDVYGVSLEPLLEGEVPERLRDLPIIAELTFLPKAKQADGRIGNADHYFKHFAVGNDRKKLMEVTRLPLAGGGDQGAKQDAAPPEPSRQLYDHATDGAEQLDLAPDAPPLLTRMLMLRTQLKEELRARFATLEREGTSQLDLSPVLEDLQDLGYIEGRPRDPGDPRRRPRK